MQGAVQWEALIWVAGMLSSAIVGAFGIWFFINRSIQAAVASMRADLGGRLDEHAQKISAAAALASLADKAVAELRAEIAEKYVHKDALKEVIEGNREIRQSVQGLYMAFIKNAPVPRAARARGK